MELDASRTRGALVISPPIEDWAKREAIQEGVRATNSFEPNRHLVDPGTTPAIHTVPPAGMLTDQGKLTAGRAVWGSAGDGFQKKTSEPSGCRSLAER